MELVIGGSDFHNPVHKGGGLAAMLTKRLPKDSFDVAALIKSRDYLLRIGGCIVLI